MKKAFLMAALIYLSMFAVESISAQTKQLVRFARGAASATTKGTVRGYAYRDYVIGARVGQTISVKLSSPNSFSVFTIFQPSGDNLEGASQMDEFTGELPVSGDYVIRVGVMRAEARRRGSISNYSLNISIR